MDGAAEPHSGASARGTGRPEAEGGEGCGLRAARDMGLGGRMDGQAGSIMKLGKELWTDSGEARPTLHVQLGPPAVALNEDGSAQEGRAAQRPHEGAEHERELQGPELRQEGGGPALAETVGDLQVDKERKVRRTERKPLNSRRMKKT